MDTIRLELGDISLVAYREGHRTWVSRVSDKSTMSEYEQVWSTEQLIASVSLILEKGEPQDPSNN